MYRCKTAPPPTPFLWNLTLTWTGLHRSEKKNRRVSFEFERTHIQRKAQVGVCCTVEIRLRLTNLPFPVSQHFISVLCISPSVFFYSVFLALTNLPLQKCLVITSQCSCLVLQALCLSLTAGLQSQISARLPLAAAQFSLRTPGFWGLCLKMCVHTMAIRVGTLLISDFFTFWVIWLLPLEV